MDTPLDEMKVLFKEGTTRERITDILRMEDLEFSEGTELSVKSPPVDLDNCMGEAEAEVFDRLRKYDEFSGIRGDLTIDKEAIDLIPKIKENVADKLKEYIKVGIESDDPMTYFGNNIRSSWYGSKEEKEFSIGYLSQAACRWGNELFLEPYDVEQTGVCDAYKDGDGFIYKGWLESSYPFEVRLTEDGVVSKVYLELD